MIRPATLKTGWTLACGLLLVSAPILATDSARGGGGVPASLTLSDAPLLVGTNWIEHFDTYVTGSQMHGQGGWKGWGNSPSAGALTSAAQALSPANSVDILGGSDLVHEYPGFTTGTWTYTAWQYIQSGTVGDTYFILLNSYDDPGATNNWSVQVCFDAATGTVVDDVPGTCTGPGAISTVFDQWVELRAVIDLDANLQTFYYNGQLLYQDSWTEHVSGAGVLSIAAVDLFANSATSVFYDDISLSNLPFIDGFESGSASEWHATVTAP